jgi:hypothetical protein
VISGAWLGEVSVRCTGLWGTTSQFFSELGTRYWKTNGSCYMIGPWKQTWTPGYWVFFFGLVFEIFSSCEDGLR